MSAFARAPSRHNLFNQLRQVVVRYESSDNTCWQMSGGDDTRYLVHKDDVRAFVTAQYNLHVKPGHQGTPIKLLGVEHPMTFNCRFWWSSPTLKNDALTVDVLDHWQMEIVYMDSSLHRVYLEDEIRDAQSYDSEADRRREYTIPEPVLPKLTDDWQFLALDDTQPQTV